MICVEGFHNYHHTFPWDYRATELPLYNMLTPTIVFIDLMAKVYTHWPPFNKVYNGKINRHNPYAVSLSRVAIFYLKLKSK